MTLCQGPWEHSAIIVSNERLVGMVKVQDRFPLPRWRLISFSIKIGPSRELSSSGAIKTSHPSVMNLQGCWHCFGAVVGSCFPRWSPSWLLS